MMVERDRWRRFLSTVIAEEREDEIISERGSRRDEMRRDERGKKTHSCKGEKREALMTAR